MPLYKMHGKKDGLQKYRVRINYVDREGNSKQLDRVAYGLEAAKDLERKLNYELKIEKPHKKITLQDLYDEYKTSKAHEVRESTFERAERTLTNHVMPYFPNTQLNKLTMPVLQKWKTQIDECRTSKDKPFSLGYKQKIFSLFRSLLNYAVKMEYISSNPLTKLGNFKDANIIKPEMDYYTSEEFLKFLAAAKNCAEESEKKTGSIYEWNYYMFFSIAFYGGMRKGEINALKWTDVSDNDIKITRSITQKLKGGDRETPPKNQSSIRTIQIPTPLQKALTEHKERYKQISGFSNDWRICGGENCIRDTTLEKRNKLYAEKAGLKKIRIHDYRHSHASLLANNGINIQEIARRLGHNNIEMTWNVYSHLYPREEERALEILNKIK